MKRWFRVTAALCLAALLAPPSSAQIPQTVSYQGRLLGEAGAPVPDGDYSVDFALYGVPAGPDAPLWTEAHAAVPVSAGYFHVMLGSLVPLDLPFNVPYWLGISVGAGSELTPRVELASSPYSLNAGSVADGAVTESKIPTGQVVKSLNSLHDAVTLAPGSNITITPSGQTLTIAATGVGLTLPYTGVVSDPGTLLYISNSGTGGAGHFRVTNAGNANPALQAVSTGTGPALVSDGITKIGGGVRAGELYVYPAGSTNAMIQGFTQSSGGRLQLHDEAANQIALLTADNDGTGAYLNVNRNTASSGFVVDGNYLGTGEPRVDVTGSARSVTFEMGSAGDNSVRLPNDAIGAFEVLDEPGIGFRAATGSVALDATDRTILSRSITAPAAGYAVVIGTVQGRVSHTNGTVDALVFAVSSAAGSMPTGWTQNIYMAAAEPTNSYYFPTTVQGVFPVAAGSATFYLLGREDSGTGIAENALLTVFYVPTAYGTVTAPPALAGMAGAAWNGTTAAVTDGGGDAGVAMERAQSDAFQRDRIDRELRTIRVEMEDLRRALEESAARQARGDVNVSAARAR